MIYKDKNTAHITISLIGSINARVRENKNELSLPKREWKQIRNKHF